VNAAQLKVRIQEWEVGWLSGYHGWLVIRGCLWGFNL